MAKVQLHTQAPDFTLKNFDDQPLTLSDFQGKKHVILVFNRGFI
jgi:peroxiredoxin